MSTCMRPSQGARRAREAHRQAVEIGVKACITVGAIQEDHFDRLDGTVTHGALAHDGDAWHIEPFNHGRSMQRWRQPPIISRPQMPRRLGVVTGTPRVPPGTHRVPPVPIESPRARSCVPKSSMRRTNRWPTGSSGSRFVMPLKRYT